MLGKVWGWREGNAHEGVFGLRTRDVIRGNPGEPTTFWSKAAAAMRQSWYSNYVVTLRGLECICPLRLKHELNFSGKTQGIYESASQSFQTYGIAVNKPAQEQFLILQKPEMSKPAHFNFEIFLLFKEKNSISISSKNWTKQSNSCGEMNRNTPWKW